MFHQRFDGDLSGKWCIVRTSGGRSLTVANSLAEAGLGAWSPRKTEERRRLRSRVRFKVEVPIMPTFVFVPACYVDDLRRILSSPIKPHPPFSIFRYGNATPLIAEAELTTIRLIEEQSKVREKKAKRYLFAVGEAVKTEEPAFLGMSGVIESCNGKRAMVDFGGGLRVNIGAWLLLEDQVRAA